MADADQYQEERWIGGRRFRKLNDNRLVEVLSDGSVKDDFTVAGQDFNSYGTGFDRLQQTHDTQFSEPEEPSSSYANMDMKGGSIPEKPEPDRFTEPAQDAGPPDDGDDGIRPSRPPGRDYPDHSMRSSGHGSADRIAAEITGQQKKMYSSAHQVHETTKHAHNMSEHMEKVYSAMAKAGNTGAMKRLSKKKKP